MMRALAWVRCGWLYAALATLALLAVSASGRADGLSMTNVERGAYLARIGDCSGCHTAPGGAPMAGGRVIPTPFGGIVVPNLTPDDVTGIGTWSIDDFWNAMHNGVRADGALLYPAFPFVAYTKVRRADANAIFIYLQSLPPVHQPRRKNTLRFPYSMRSVLHAWRALYFTAGQYHDDPAQDAQWNRGAYLVQGLGHCQGCHTRRNSFGAVTTDATLAGGMIPLQDWYAANLVAENGPRQWPAGELATFLKTGVSAHHSAFGPMAEVIHDSLQYLTDADAQAMATYLTSLPAASPGEAVQGIEPPPRQIANLRSEGKALYKKHCAACHQKDGHGVTGIYPSLAGNASVTAAHVVNPIRMILLGGFAPPTAANPRPYSMPAFSQKLDDREVAALVTYIRKAWGNNATAVSPRTIHRYRSTPEN